MSEWVGVHLYAPTHAAHAVIPPLPPPAPPALPCRAVLPPCLAPPLPLPQNQFLQPNAAMVERLASQLEAKKIGVVAHFYMDPEVQGVLSSAGALGLTCGTWLGGKGRRVGACSADREQAAPGRCLTATLGPSTSLSYLPFPPSPALCLLLQPSAGRTSTSATLW
jgi:hypothetical protein